MSIRYETLIVTGWFKPGDWDWEALTEAGIEEDNIFDTSPMTGQGVVVGVLKAELDEEEICLNIRNFAGALVELFPKPKVYKDWKYGVWLIARYV